MAATQQGFTYRRLDFKARKEIRLLTLCGSPSDLSASSDTSVECTIDHFSLCDWSPAYKSYAEESSKQKLSPRDAWDRWEDFARRFSDDNGGMKPTRFTWGDFSALSYTWGNPAETGKITLNAFETTVRANLEAALRFLRDQSAFKNGLKLWVDAVCIDQGNLNEKAEVIPGMRQLYENAWQVSVWLGTAINGTESVRTLKDYARNYPSDGFFTDIVARVPDVATFKSHFYPALVTVLDRPYWNRLWIVQEIALACPNRVIYIGGCDLLLTWRELGIVLSIYSSMYKVHSPSEFGNMSLGTNVWHRVKLNVGHIYALMVRDNFYCSLAGLGRENILFRRSDWTLWLWTVSLTEVTEEQDRVYGILGLLPQEIADQIVPDYKKPVRDVFLDFTASIINATNCLDFLFSGFSRHPTITQPVNRPELPSWAYELTNMGTYGRSSLQGKLASGGRDAIYQLRDTNLRYGANIPDAWRPVYELSQARRVLSLRAIRVDYIAAVAGRKVIKDYTAESVQVPTSFIPGTVYDFGKSEGEARSTLSEVLDADTYTSGSFFKVDQPSTPEIERTHASPLLHIPWPSASKVGPSTSPEELEHAVWRPVVSSPYFQYFETFRQSHADFPLWDGRLFRDFYPPKVVADRASTSQESIERIRATVNAGSSFVFNKLIMTKERGLLGITSVHDTRVMDEIYIVLGCTYPVVLRAVPPRVVATTTGLSEEEAIGYEGRWFTLVGGCFVSGIMYGEVMRAMDRGEAQMEMINLV